MRVLFDKNVPVGVRNFLPEHQVKTIVEMNWPERLANGELIDAAEKAGFEVLLTADQNIRHQQNLAGRAIALVVLGSNIWPIVRSHSRAIAAAIAAAKSGTYLFVEMPLPARGSIRT